MIVAVRVSMALAELGWLLGAAAVVGLVVGLAIRWRR
ncbi:hypothetical protein JOD67_004466 [Tenggerimyces flavus]|nr:hypothetical protein [Tenggerimyces flavus]